MSEVATTNKNTPQGFIKDINVQKMITERLGKRAGQFTTSLLSLVNANSNIAACKPVTIVQAALTAASMDLPINQNLGVAYIVPYKNHGVMEAQFQMGWKGFVQLAQRSGVFKTINSTDVRDGEVKSRDRMTGELKFSWIDDDEERNSKEIVGYLAYFELLNGFKKSLYMTKAEIEKHAGRYSQAYRAKGKSSFKSPWETDFDLMAQKTALKQLLSKYAPLSTEMQEAVAADQSVDDGTGRRYIDNDELNNEKASDDEKSAIIDANSEDATVQAPEAEVIKDQADPTDQVPAEPVEQAAAEAKAPAPKKKSVKEMAEERGWSKDGKQSKLVDTDDTTS
jgi:recombination protein RecT